MSVTAPRPESTTDAAERPARPPLERVRITIWEDPLVDRLGHDPRSGYVEQFWLGVLGPSTVWFLRHCAAALDEGTEGASLDLAETAAALGLGHRGGRSSPLARSILRACRFGAARAAGEDELQVRRRLPPLSLAQVQRLPEGLRREHQRFLDRELRPGDAEHQRLRARRLALGLVECGDRLDDAELQLGRWRFHPSIAAEAVQWAWSAHHGPPDAA